MVGLFRSQLLDENPSWGQYLINVCILTSLCLNIYTSTITKDNHIKPQNGGVKVAWALNSSCPYRHDLISKGLQFNVCKLRNKIVLDLRLFHKDFPTQEGVLIDVLDYTYMTTSLRPKILQDLLHLKNITHGL